MNKECASGVFLVFFNVLYSTYEGAVLYIPVVFNPGPGDPAEPHCSAHFLWPRPNHILLTVYTHFE